MGDAEFPVPDIPVHVYVIVSLVVVSLLLSQMLGLWLTGFAKPGQGTAAAEGSIIIGGGHMDSCRGHNNHGHGGPTGVSSGNENEKPGNLKGNNNPTDNKEKETEVARPGSTTTAIVGGGRVRGLSNGTTF